MYGKLIPVNSPSTPLPAKIDDHQLATWRAFLRAHSTMLRHISRDLEGAGLPPLAWYDVLATLQESPDQQLRQVEIAEQVLLSNSGLSRLIDRIEEKGLVERVSCPSDRRAFFVCLTDAGREMLEEMWPVYARGIAEDFLPALGSNLSEVRRTLEAVAQQCEAGGAEEGAARTAPSGRTAATEPGR
jgi:DNA-binding MarR family transcriptional regulator